MQSPILDHQEVEWQFDAVDVRPVGRWLENRSHWDGPAVAAREVRELTDTYLDTEDWRLYRASYVLRLRDKEGAGAREVTMKTLDSRGEAPGLRVRREISGIVQDKDTQPGSLLRAPNAIGDHLRALAGSGDLSPIFTIETRRSVYALSLHGDHVGEVVLDETAIPLDGGVEPARLRRVEVELDTDPESLAAMQPFIEQLREECRLMPATTTKYEAALFARGLTPPEAPHFGPTQVDASLTIGEVAFAVMREQLEIFLAHEPGTRLGEDPEELHDMRVASRRMRAAIRIFGEALPVRVRKQEQGLRWIAGVLGEVRDLDVQLEQLETWISEAAPEDQEALGTLRAVLEERRGKARKAMLRALDSRRYGRLVESLSALLRRGPSRRSVSARHHVLAVAPDLIRAPYRKVRKLGDRLDEESPAEDYHKLRKRGKRLRYALEFFSGVYGKPVKGLIPPLKSFQDVLGDHQDATVATSHLRELATGQRRGRKLPTETIFVMGAISHGYELKARDLRYRFPKAYGKIKGKPWRKLARTLDNHRLTGTGTI